MRKQHQRRQPRPPASGPVDPNAVPSFTPVLVRPRHDGWTPERQVRFIQALAATGCVEDAARHVGMTARSARDLRTRRDAESLRAAWDAALASGVDVLAEAVLSRAIHGVAVPIFYKGEQVGERRRFDERMAAFLLRYHAPHRYGAWRDRAIVTQSHPDATAILLQESIKRLVADCVSDTLGDPRQPRVPLRTEAFADDPEIADNNNRLDELRRQAEWKEFERRLAAERSQWQADARAAVGNESSAGDGSSTSLDEGRPAVVRDQGGS